MPWITTVTERRPFADKHHAEAYLDHVEATAADSDGHLVTSVEWLDDPPVHRIGDPQACCSVQDAPEMPSSM